MAAVSNMPSKEEAVYENEYAKTKEVLHFKGVPADKLKLYLSYAAKDDEWKALNTKKLLRKVDIRLLPLLILMYLLNFLNRSNLAQVRLGTLETGLGMKGTDFNIGTSILFVGYLIMQVPSDLLLTRVPPAIYHGCAMAVWGVIPAAHASTKSFGALLVCRILHGVGEAPFLPGAIMLCLFGTPALSLLTALLGFTPVVH